MPLDAENLIIGFIVSFFICLLTLRMVCGKKVPLLLCGIICIPMASLIAISEAIDAQNFLKYFIYIESAYFIFCSIIVRINKNIKYKLKLIEINPALAYYLNGILCFIFIPIFLGNIIGNENALSDRITSIQGLGFLFYPHYFLSLSILTLYLVKLISGEPRNISLTFVATLSAVSIIAFGSRFFPLLIIVGIMLMLDINKYKRAKIFIAVILGLGLLYYNLVTNISSTFLSALFFRLFNSSDIIYYLDNPKSFNDIITLYPYNIADLLLNPFLKLFNKTHIFASPGPFLFNGSGQGPLPSFYFDSFFYFGYFGFLYLLIFPLIFWYMVSIAAELRVVSNDGVRIFVYCLLFLPALSLMSDLSSFNGFFYLLLLLFTLSRLRFFKFIKTNKINPI